MKGMQNISSRLSEPLSGSFQDRYQWWASVELTRRFILILSVVAFPAYDVS